MLKVVTCRLFYVALERKRIFFLVEILLYVFEDGGSGFGLWLFLWLQHKSHLYLFLNTIFIWISPVRQIFLLLV